VRWLARACHAKASHPAREEASAAACSRVSRARASQPARAEASAAVGPSGGAAASLPITGVGDEHAYELFEEEDRLDAQMWVPPVVTVNTTIKQMVLT
jgi:hypothetical protein